MWYRVFPWLFIFHSSLMDSLRKYFREHRRVFVVHAEKHPSDLNAHYKVAKVEDLSSSSFVMSSVFAEFGGHVLEQEQFAMDVDKTCFTLRRNLHWNTLPARLCRPHCWKPSCKKSWDTHRWPHMEQRNRLESLWVPPNLSHHVILWVWIVSLKYFRSKYLRRFYIR